MIYSVDYLPRALFDTRDYTRLDLSGSVFDILEKDCHQQISSNVAHLKASCGDDAIRAAMRLAPGEAMLLLDEYLLQPPVPAGDAVIELLYQFL